ncbi:MAG: MFS transporter [Chloroflexi bacterium]|nr:MFS transporter [Chloroflexota bacterium]
MSDPESGASAGTTPPQDFGFNPFRSLRYGDYRFVWSSEALNLWASEMETIVLAIFVLRETGSPLLVGLIGALKFGGTLLGPIYGLMVDRFDRKRLQVGVRVIGLSLAGFLRLLIVKGALELWHAYVIVSVGSTVRMLDIVLVQTLTADVVPARSLHGAIGLSRISLDGARVAGSLAGGVIFEVLGLNWAYVMITVIYLLATLASVKIGRRKVITGTVGFSGEQSGQAERSGRPGRSGPPGMRAGLSEGLRHVMRSDVLPGLIFFSFLIELSAFPIVNGLMTVIGDELYGLGGAGIGLLAAAASGGALLGALTLGSKRNIGSPTRLMVLGSIAWHVLMLVLALSLPLWLFSLILIVWGFSGGMTFVAMVVGLLRAAPAEFRGRVMGIRTLGIYGLPIGLLLGGWIAEEVGAQAMIGVLGGIGLTATLIAAIVWPALLRRTPTPQHESPAPRHEPKDKTT